MINPTESFRFDGAIWRIVPGEEPFLAIEVRNDQELEVKFFVLDLQSMNLKEVKDDQLDWWVSLIAYTTDRLSFKRYEVEGNPFTGESFIWDQKKNQIRPSERLSQGRTHQRFRFPVLYTPDTKGHGDFVKFLASKGVETKLGIEYLEWDKYLILSYHLAQESRFDRKIMVTDDKGNLIIHESLDEKNSGVAFESFLTFSNLLIFVRNRNELVFYSA